MVSRASQESLNPNLSRWKGEQVGDSSEEGESMPAGNKDQNPPPPPKNKVSKLIQMPIDLVRQGWSDVGRHLRGALWPCMSLRETLQMRTAAPAWNDSSAFLVLVKNEPAEGEALVGPPFGQVDHIRAGEATEAFEDKSLWSV